MRRYKLPNKKYNIIYADPPWSFSSKELQKYGGVRFTSMDKHYQTQSKNWIKELPVKNISKNDCALFMWTTDAHIKEAIETIESWGFKYKTIAFVWEKKTKTGKTVANLGAWTMKNYEICLLGTKGAMLKHKKVNNIYQKVEEVRTKHSKKPSKVRKNIEELFGNLPRIELFARQKVSGWDAWGNEITKHEAGQAGAGHARRSAGGGVMLDLRPSCECNEGAPYCITCVWIGIAEKAERERDEATKSKDGAYSERDQLVCALSKFLPAWLERHPDSDKEWEDDWRWTVFIDGPTGQMTWHIHDSELEWFDHLPRSITHRWDGHTTDEKYARLAELEVAREGES